MNQKIKKALEHVRQFHPTVDRVVFWREGRWIYSDESLYPIAFDDEIDVGILEDAMDEADNYELPKAFQL